MLIQGILHKRANDVLKLECSLGHFSIYQGDLNMLVEGSHAGLFEIANIKANMQSNTNSDGLPTLTLEVVAELSTYAFISESKQVTTQPAAHENSSVLSLEPEIDDEALFGELWPLANLVKLDETHPNFRAQVKRMNEFKAAQKYTYRGAEKVWVKLN